jgi:type II secretory pathway pseudopilin PulG
MAILGLLLVLAATGLTLDVVFQNTSSISVDALGQTFTLSSGWLFTAGVITGVVGLLGVTLLLGGMTRARRRQAALAQSRRAARDLQVDRDRLAAELDQERATTPSPLQPSQTPANGPAAVDLASEERRGAPSTENTDLANSEGREPVAAGRHGIFHRNG